MTTKAHDMEVVITNQQRQLFCFTKSKKHKVEFKKNVKFSMNWTKIAMLISTGKPVRITKKPQLEDKNSASFIEEAPHTNRALGEVFIP